MAKVFSALNRRLREAHLNPADYTRIANDFAAICAAEYDLVELTPAVNEFADFFIRCCAWLRPTRKVLLDGSYAAT